MHLSSVKFNINYIAANTSFKGANTQATTARHRPKADEFIRTAKQPTTILKRGQILDCGEIYTSSATEFFRFDIDWNEFSRYLKERFKNFDKVNTYVYACSDGSEAYSLSMMMQHKFKDKADKFFPVYAKDIDENIIKENIQNLKTGKIKHKQLNIATIANAINIDKASIEQEFATIDHSLIANPKKKVTKLQEKVTQPVIFSEANILDDIKNIDSKNPSIIMCRNMWPYVETSEYPEFAKNLYEKLKDGSIVVLGAFDCFFDKIEGHDLEKISKALLNTGFEESKCEINDKYNLIFEKN